MSMWNKNSGLKDKVKYAHWPNPFNYIKNIEVQACEPNMEFWVDFAFPVFGEFFYTNFIPSPKEVIRKVLLGGYKCGFYWAPRIKSPLNIIWGAGTTRVLASILSPAIAPLFYWWAGSTAFEAMQTWQSMIYAMEKCEQNPYSAIVAGGSGTKVGDGQGAPVGYNAIWDPQDWLNPADTAISIPEGGCKARNIWAIQNVGPVPVTVDLWTHIGNKAPDTKTRISLAVGQGTQESTENQGSGLPGEVQPRFEVFSSAPLSSRVSFRVDRLYADYYEPPLPVPPRPLPVKQLSPCFKCIQQIFGPLH